MPKNTGKPENMASVSWLWGDVASEDAVSLGLIDGIISTYLMSGPASPFYQALIQSGVGTAYSTYAGYHNHTRETYFTIGVRDTDQQDKLEQIVLNTIKHVIDNGFDHLRLMSILHQFEIGLKTQSPSFGMNLSFGLMPAWQHGANPIDQLKMSEQLHVFKNAYNENNSFLTDRLKAMTLDNPHRVTLIMQPEEGYMENEQAKENALLEEIKANMTQKELDDIFNQGQELRRYQNSEQDINLLPTLDPDEDIAKDSPNNYVLDKSNPNIIYHQNSNTGGLVHLNIKIPLQGDFDTEELQTLSLFNSYILQAGAGKFNQQEFAVQKDLSTGNMSIGTVINEEGITLNLNSYCLEENVDDMLNLWRLVFDSPRLQEKQILDVILKQAITNLASGIQGQGHGYAMRSASSFLTKSARYSEMLSGLEQLEFLKNTNVKLALVNIRELFVKIFNKTTQKSLFVCSRDQLPQMKQFLSDIYQPKDSNNEPSSFNHTYFSFPSVKKRHWNLEGCLVNYVSLAIPVTQEADFAKLRVLSHLVSAKFCHPLIRERNGAYGGGMQPPNLGADLKTLRFFSYRDPSSLDTLGTFKHAYYYIRKEKAPIMGEYTDLPEWTVEDLKEAKLRAFQAIDAPVKISSLGKSEVFSGVSQAQMEQYRTDCLKVTEQDIYEMADKYLSVDLVADGNLNNGVTIIGPKEFSLEGNPKWEMKDC